LIRLVAVDIDGTLLEKDHSLSEHARLAKKLCDDAGVFFTLATGRVSASAEKVASDLGVTVPVISNGGAAIKLPGGRYLRELVVPRDAAIRAIEAGRRHGVERYIYAGEAYLTETPGAFVGHYGQGLGIPIEVVPDLTAFVSGGALSIVFRVDPASDDMDERITALATDLIGIAHGEYRVDRSMEHLIEVLHPVAGKGEALKALAQLLDLDVSECLAIGDSLGDLDMLDVAGKGVLVNNAAPAIRGDRVLTSEGYSRGVLEAVRRFVVNCKI
jgi:Cof subfamily protein (haloacid dehalogenase superfamily)